MFANLIERKIQITKAEAKKAEEGTITENEIQSLDEIPMQESIDKMTVLWLNDCNIAKDIDGNFAL